MNFQPFFVNDFTSVIHPFWLTFNDKSIENLYVTARLNFTQITKSARYFMVSLIIGGCAFGLLNLVTGFIWTENYDIGYIGWVALGNILLTVIFEYIAYKNLRLAPYRGLFFTAIGGVMLFGVSFILNNSKTFYPVLNSEYYLLIYSTIITCAALINLNIHYPKTWVIAFVSFSMLFIELSIMMCIIYSSRYMDAGTLSGVYDNFYYFCLYGLFFFLCVYSVRIYEYGE